MNTQEKATQQKYIQQGFTGLGAVIVKLVQDRDGNAAQLQTLNMHGTETYTQEYIEREMTRIKTNFSVKMAETYQDLETRLETLRKMISDRDAVLDLTNPALSTALALIQAAGGAPTHEQAAQINQNFRYDQSGIRAIYSAYGQKDIGGIGKMMYNVDEVIDGLKVLANDCTIKEGSVNYFASKLSTFAAIEGVELPTTPDERGYDESFRKGAGLK